MNIELFVLAAWLYLGRAILLVVGLREKREGVSWQMLNRLAGGLLVAPIVIAISAAFSTPFIYPILMLVVIDLILIYLYLKSRHNRTSLVSKESLVIPVFSIVCMVLAYFNGPLIEHLTDAWWHMNKAAQIRSNESFALKEGPFGLLGINQTSYRMQGLLSWLTGAPILHSWYATSVVVCGLLGVSALTLFRNLYSDRLAILVSILFWMILMGGLNTGFRLTGWPAAMGYVFLNLGLLASYHIFRDIFSKSAWFLLFLCALGMAFFHIGELFLILLAIFALLAARFLFASKSNIHSILTVVLSLIGILIAYYIHIGIDGYISIYAFIYSAVLIIGLACLGAGYRDRSAAYIVSGALVLLMTLILGLINWPHLLKLFDSKVASTTNYYSAYIPEFYRDIFDGPIRLPKWEHQLRASLLWSGALSVPVSVWLAIRKPGTDTYWLLVLTVVPWLILISPSLFSTLLSIAPDHGVYRVQLIMPISLVMGSAIAYSINELRFSWSGAIKGGLHSLKLVKSDIGIRFVVFAAVAAVFGLMFYGGRVYATEYFKFFTLSKFVFIVLILAMMIILFGMRYRTVAALSVLSACIISAVPDFMVRAGIASSRAWAIHSNQGYHWRLIDRRPTFEAHTSMRYQGDLIAIRKELGSQDNLSFVSDLATSYYVGAETGLLPLVQHPHHSTSGARINEAFQNFCKGDTFSQLSEGIPNLSYLVLNKDTLNYTAEINGAFCVGEPGHINSRLLDHAKMLYSGEFLDLWKVK